jgi:hypothetical protein
MRDSQSQQRTTSGVLAWPAGWVMLTAVALGFLAFGLFALLESRYRRM